MKELIILFGLISAFALFLMFIIFTRLYYKDRIYEGKDFKEHLIIGSANIFLGITIFMTDFQNGYDVFIQNLYEYNSPMPLQYLFWAALNCTLIRHLYKQHYKK